MSTEAKTGLTTFAEASTCARTGTRPVLLHVSPHLFGQMEARAAADRFNLHEWVLRAVISELLRPEAELAVERRARTAIASMPCSASARPTHERKSHASHC